jgi:hypothetical protein
MMVKHFEYLNGYLCSCVSTGTTLFMVRNDECAIHRF